MAIEAEHYEATRLRLIADPVVRDMAAGLEGVPLEKLQHESGDPRFEFMQAANFEYTSRINDAGYFGRSDDSAPRHIGAVAEALLRILKNQ